MASHALSPIVSSAMLTIVIGALILVFYGFAIGFLGSAQKTVVEGSGFTSLDAGAVIESYNTDSDIIYLRTTNDSLTPVIQSVFEDDELTSCNNVLLSPTGIVELNSSNCPGLTVESSKEYVITGTDGLYVTGFSTN